MLQSLQTTFFWSYFPHCVVAPRNLKRVWVGHQSQERQVREHRKKNLPAHQFQTVCVCFLPLCLCLSVSLILLFLLRTYLPASTQGALRASRSISAARYLVLLLPSWRGC